MSKNYLVINEWDISRLLQLAPQMDAPIRVLDFNRIPCSIYGSPLEVDSESNTGYQEIDRRYRKADYEKYRSIGRVVKVNYKGNDPARGHLNRYIIGMERDSKLDPIMEVTNGGRCVLRCKQWAKVLRYAYDEKVDEMTLDYSEYSKLLHVLKNRLLFK